MADVYKNLRAANIGLTPKGEQVQRLIAPGEVFEAEEGEIPKNWLEPSVGYVRKADKDERALFEQQRKTAAATPGEAGEPQPEPTERKPAERVATERAPETPPPAAKPADEEHHSKRGR